MKKITIILGAIFFGGLTYAQQNPTGNPPGNPNNVSLTARSAWYRGGNDPFGPAGTNNIFGTMWNSPIYTYTNGIARMIVNGDGTFANGTNTSGFIGIGTTNPFSPLHVVGSQNANAQGWSRGVTLSDNAILQWDGGGGGGFFMAHPSGTPNGNWYAWQNANTTPTSPVDYAFSVFVNDNLGTINPLRSTRFYKNLLVHQGGFGRRIGVNTLNPQRSAEIYSNTTQMRLSYGATNSTINAPTVFTDFQTNPNGNLLIRPTGQRMGVNLNTNPSHTLDVNGNARVRNVPIAGAPQSLIIGQQVGGGNDRELQRLDFTGNANEVLLGNGTWGPATPNNIANNGIFINNNDEIQLGAPCNSLFPLLASRFTESRAVYLNNNSFWLFSGANQNGGVGLGAQPASAGLCGVGNTVEISANNQGPYGNTDASGLRFTKLTSASPTIANGTNGVDDTKLLSVDQNGDVVLVEVVGGSGGSTLANNGTSIDPGNPNTIQLGQNFGAAGNPAELLNNREIPMNNFNLLFTDNNSANYGSNFIGIGTSNPDSKLDIRLNNAITTNNSRALRLENHASGVSARGIEMVIDGTSDVKRGISLLVDGSANPSSSNEGIRSNVEGGLTTNAITGYALDAPQNRGVIGVALSTNAPANSNIGVQGTSNYGEYNFGGMFSGYSGAITQDNYGVFARAVGPGAMGSYAVYGTSYGSTNPFIYAGYFNGQFVQTGGAFTPSDLNLKVNIDSLNNSLTLINQIKYEYGDYSQSNSLHLPEDEQIGFIAQEIEQLIPNAVIDVRHPDDVDSAGNIINPGLTYKAINYEQLIPVAIQGVKELNAKVDSLDYGNRIDSLVQAVDSLNNTVADQQGYINDLESENASQQSEIDDLTNRLDQLENCLGNLLPILCQINNAAINQNDDQTQDQLTKTLNLKLSDGDNIVLEQNVPNPFKEQTVINFYIPESVKTASIAFYSRTGQLIRKQVIDARGNGRINVYGNDLSSGMYTYSLIADGQVVATKKMVKTH